MSSNVPYVFIGGKSAKAQEVNANFNYIMNLINNLTTVIAGLNASITQLQEEKADLNGNSNVPFSVAKADDAYMSERAVPYSQVSEMLFAVKNLYKGFSISTYSTTQGNWGLTVGIGTCWDSLGKYIIDNQTNISQSFDGQITMSGTTYKIWVIASPISLSNIRISVGLGEKPTLLGDEVYKLIARINTSSSGFGTVTYVDGRIS